MRRCGAVRLVEQRVARRERQSVLSADDGAFDDLHRQFQLGRHRLDHGDLLEILLPEVGACRAHDVEQAADDLRHTVEVSGARRTLHHLVDLPEIENPGVFLGIYLFDRRHQHEIRAGLFQQAPVGLRGAGVVPQVVLVVELRGVHEDAHDDRGVLPAGALHERAVARMQGAHRGYEADTRLFRPVQFGAKFLDACKYFHLFLETSCGAKVEIPADIKKENRRKSITFVGILISNEHEKAFYYCIYDTHHSRTDLVRRWPQGRYAVDRRPFRRHQGHPLRSSRFRRPAARREGADLLPLRGCQMRPRHSFRPELPGEPPRAPHAGDGLREL